MRSWLPVYHQSVFDAAVAVIPLTISIFIILSNFLVLITLKYMKNLRIQHYYMFCLATVNLLTLAPYSLITVILLQGGIWLTEPVCNSIGTILMTLIGISNIIHGFMCGEKLMSVIKPLCHRHCIASRRSRIVQIAALISSFMLVALLLSVLGYVGVVRFEFYPAMHSCVIKQDALYMSLAATSLILLPLAIQLCTHVLIIVIIKKNIRRKLRASRAILIVAFTVTVHYICWIPALIHAGWTVFSHSPPPNWLPFLAMNMLMLNNGIHALIYSCSYPRISIRWQRQLKKLCV